MIEQFKQIVVGQIEAGLSMLAECIHRCPPEHWDAPVAKYPFWQVAYHTLCFVDVYLSPSDSAWQPQTTGPGGGLHPRGRAELEAEYPSRRFDRSELLDYVTLCRRKLHDALAAETAESLSGASGFAYRRFSRAELHLYNLRHLQHHAGQLTALLHRIGLGTRWAQSGWQCDRVAGDPAREPAA
ncbi:MAG: DinB family protein [Phycisphaerales bacterium]|nr:DinB family protein [Phycisphaerales bacterium]